MKSDVSLEAVQFENPPASPAAGRSKLFVKTSASGNKGTAMIQGASVGERGIGTRWGTTTTWHYADSTDVPVSFPDGYPPNIGDIVVSINGFSWGELYYVTAVYASGNADLGYTGLYFHSWTDSGWLSFSSFSNGWYQYPGWETVSYRKVNGIVYLRGLLAPGTTTAGTLITTLPTGYRPAGADPSHTHVATGAGGGCINIYGNGQIVTNYGCTGYLSLNNVSFPEA